jgi:hypothetical protein
MKWIAAVVVGSLALSAHATPAEPGTPAAAPKKATPQARAPALTLETLDRYIQYRRESDAATQQASAGILQQAREGSTHLTFNLQKMKEQDDAIRAKHGLAGEDFRQLDQMVRDISEARFKAESATAKAALQRLEAQAAGPESPERDMARSLMAYWKKDMQVDPQLRKQREAYGSATVDLVLQREKELKELWVRKDAAAAEAFKSLGAPPAPGK